MLFETHNPFDHFAIKVCKVGNENAVCQLPREILRVTKFFLDRGAIVSAQLTSEHYRQSPCSEWDENRLQSHSEDTCYVRKYFC